MDYTLEAFNSATASDNKIHDDAVAKRFGFRGGLVPGVDVYAYITHLIVARWGRAWLGRGTAGVRFLAPVYDGEQIVVHSTAGDDGALDLEVHGPDGGVRATARATLAASVEAPALESYPSAPTPAVPPPASTSTLVAGAVLGTFELGFRRQRAAQYLAEVRETLPLYGAEGIAHPGFLLRNANWVLSANVRLGPWIHVASEVHNFGLAADGDRIATRGRVAAVYEKKGHRFVDLDLLLVANGERPLCRVLHTAIFEPRQTR